MLRISPLGAAAIALASCGEPATGPLAGEWTPVHINDCSAGGSTIRVTDESVFYRGGSNQVRIAMVTGFSQPGPDLIDLKVRPENGPADGSGQFGREQTLRFRVESPDHVRVIGESFDGVTFEPLTIPTINQTFNMKRCDGGG